MRKRWGELTTNELYSFLKLRTDVFLVEQRVDDEELDNRDLEPTTEHWFCADDTGTSAYLRVLENAEPEYRDARLIIGRVVVRADRRGEGLARRLLSAVIEARGAEPMLLHAQTQVEAVYARHEFEPFGEVYREAGIPHISMYRAGTVRSS